MNTQTDPNPTPESEIPKIRRKRTPKPLPPPQYEALKDPSIQVTVHPQGPRTATSKGVRLVKVAGFNRAGTKKSPVTGRTVKFTKTYAPPAAISRPAIKPPAAPVKLTPPPRQPQGISHPPAGMPVIRKSILASSPVKGIR